MRHRTATRSGLDKASIVAAALRIVRTEGLPALTMRRVAAELSSAPMSLYVHVADRQALLIGMLDEVIGSFEIPPPQEDPRAEIVAICDALWHLYVADPWIVHLRVVENLGSVHTLKVLDRIFAALFRTGVEANRGWVIYRALFNFIYGDILTTYHAQGADAAVHRLFFTEGRAHPAVSRMILEQTDVSQSTYRFTKLLANFLDGLLDGPTGGQGIPRFK